MKKTYLKLHNFIFEEVKQGSAKAQAIQQKAQYNQGDLFDAYGRTSAEKRRTWRNIEAFAEAVGGVAYVCGHNCFMYSAIVKTNNMIYYFTASNQYAVYNS